MLGQSKLQSVVFGTTLALAFSAFASGPSDVVERAVKSGKAESEQVQAALTASELGKSIHTAASAFAPIALPTVPTDWQAAGLDLSKAERVGDELIQTLKDGSRVVFTVDPDVQVRLEKMLNDNKVPHSGIVLMEPKTGRLKAFVSHTNHTPEIPDIAVKSTAPSASVFKVVTAAALIEAGHDPQKSTCYHGGRSRLSAENIKGNPRKDNVCNSLGPALAWSINSIMAKLAYTQLKKEDLEVWAERFGYNSEIPFELPVEVSTADFVDDKLERARSAAGFWHTYMSPLHGAMIGGALKNEGVMMQPSLIERYESADGTVLKEFEPTVFRRVMRPETAQLLGKMMEQTATEGTARRYFRQRPGFPSNITVSGKTGTLSNKNPYLGFTWFVGYASDSITKEEIAVSGLVCNTPVWRIKGGFAASEAVVSYFNSLAKRETVAQR